MCVCVCVFLLARKKDYKRRDELRGGSVITTDPGVSEVRDASDSSGGRDGGGGNGSAPPTSNTKAAVVGRTYDSEGTEKTDAGLLLDDAAGGGAVVGGDAERCAVRQGGSCRDPGRMPLNERPRKHRKYYKVGEAALNQRGTQSNRACSINVRTITREYSHTHVHTNTSMLLRTEF